MISDHRSTLSPLERTVNAKVVGALEAQLLEGPTAKIEVNYLDLEGLFLATLFEEAEIDEPEGTMRPVLRASGQTIVEEVMQLELAYQRLATR